MGRPRKYDEDYLLSLIKEVAKDLPQSNITYVLLEKETGIPRHVWKNGTYKKINPLIKRLNKKLQMQGVIDTAKVRMPNLLAEIKAAAGNEKKTRLVAEQHMQLEMKLLEAVDRLTSENNELNKKVANQAEEIARLESNNSALESQIAACYVQSSNPAIRKKESLKTPSEITGQIKTHSRISDPELKQLLDSWK